MVHLMCQIGIDSFPLDAFKVSGTEFGIARDFVAKKDHLFVGLRSLRHCLLP